MSRMPAAQPAETPGLHEVLSEIESTRGWVSNALAAFAHAPEGLRRFAALGEYVRFQSVLPARTRELVIITIARSCEYAWVHHTEFARKAGVTEAEVAQIKEGRIPSTASSDERLALEYVHAFVEGRHVGDAPFKALLAAIGPRGITDLTLLTGYFRTLGGTLAAFEVDLEPRELLDRYWQGGGRATLER
jgi:4-carboxymuconolactone decarboxylase